MKAILSPRLPEVNFDRARLRRDLAVFFESRYVPLALWNIVETNAGESRRSAVNGSGLNFLICRRFAFNGSASRHRTGTW
jgi:hypothetical protein